MDFFNSGLFWFLEGIFACLIVIGFKMWAEDRKIKLTLWKWVLFGGWICLLAFSIAFVFTSLGEREEVAATMGGLIFGSASLISGLGLWRLLHLKEKGERRRTLSRTKGQMVPVSHEK